jgi:hypothetical protein
MARHHKHVTPCLNDYPFLPLELDLRAKGDVPNGRERQVSLATVFGLWSPATSIWTFTDVNQPWSTARLATRSVFRDDIKVRAICSTPFRPVAQCVPLLLLRNKNGFANCLNEVFRLVVDRRIEE